MNISTYNKKSFESANHQIFVVDDRPKWKSTGLAEDVIAHFKTALEKDLCFATSQEGQSTKTLFKFTKGKNSASTLENLRRTGAAITAHIKKEKLQGVAVLNASSVSKADHALVEGITLSDYRFDKYFTKNKKAKTEVEVGIAGGGITKRQLEKIETLCSATKIARDLVNEPLSYLTAEQYAKDIQKLGKESGFKVTVYNKTKIESLKMGGLLAVNLGSPLPPTFSILEWKPKRCRNKKPLVLVGKGVVYDTGGLSLKPTANSMDMMKCDMGGSAAVVGAMVAIAKNNLPVHVIGLVPATDNRPGGNAYVPGDVITMHNKMTVEVLNTDAEGRMLLADALSYAKKYDPELVIDLATLTGSAARALGSQAAVSMGTAPDKIFRTMEKAGESCHERVCRFPFFPEYGAMIKSDIADIKNIGGPMAGAITAGKFLEHFTDYPWMHIDIAGPTYLARPDAYRPKNGSGYGVRLLYNFVVSNYNL